MMKTTKLDPVRPAVVRRRIVDLTAPSEDEDNGPPSSVNVARALASLRADEVRRLEQILSEDELAEARRMAEIEEERARQAEEEESESARSVPTIRMGSSVTLAELAKGIGVAEGELVNALVAQGFFSITAKTTLSRETARVAAQIFGWQVEEIDDEPEASKTKPKAAKAAAKNKTTKAPAKSPKPKSSKR